MALHQTLSSLRQAPFSPRESVSVVTACVHKREPVSCLSTVNAQYNIIPVSKRKHLRLQLFGFIYQNLNLCLLSSIIYNFE